MGDTKAGKSLNERQRLKKAVELTYIGWQKNTFRDEFYMQVIKQTTCNNKPYVNMCNVTDSRVRDLVTSVLLLSFIISLALSLSLSLAHKKSFDSAIIQSEAWDLICMYIIVQCLFLLLYSKSLELGWKLISAYLYYFTGSPLSGDGS